MKTFLIPSAILVSLVCVSCFTNRPAPDDDEGRVWAQDIQSAYPNWQPPEKMPAGNPAYESVFDHPDEFSVQTPVKTEPVADVIPVVQPAENTPVQTSEIASGNEASDQNAAALENDVASVAETEISSAHFARVDIREDVPLTLNGFEKNEADFENFLKESAKQSSDFNLIIYYDESSRDRLSEIVELAQKCGIQKINAMSRDDLLEAQLELVAKNNKNIKREKAQTVEAEKPAEVLNGNPPAEQTAEAEKTAEVLNGNPPAEQTAEAEKPAEEPVRMIKVADAEKPAAEYVVLEGDSLSIIAKKQYHDGALWPILLEANKTVLDNTPDRLIPGMKLSIPVLKSVPATKK